MHNSELPLPTHWVYLYPPAWNKSDPTTLFYHVSLSRDVFHHVMVAKNITTSGGCHDTKCRFLQARFMHRLDQTKKMTWDWFFTHMIYWDFGLMEYWCVAGIQVFLYWSFISIRLFQLKKCGCVQGQEKKKKNPSTSLCIHCARYSHKNCEITCLLSSHWRDATQQVSLLGMERGLHGRLSSKSLHF